MALEALEVLRELVRLIDYRTGRLEPALTTLMRRVKRSKDAVVRALANLRTHGFLDWLRRWEATGATDGGPPVKQATNAYRLTLPPAAEKLLGHLASPPPAPHRPSGTMEPLRGSLGVLRVLRELCVETLDTRPVRANPEKTPRRPAPKVRWFFSTWAYSSSTGVARPKMETVTRRRARSLVDLFDRAVEAGEGTVDDPHRFADLELDGRLGPLHPFLDGADDVGHLSLRDRHRLGAGAEEAGDLGGCS